MNSRVRQVLVSCVFAFGVSAQLQPGDPVVTRSILPHFNGPLYVTMVPRDGSPTVDLYTGNGHQQFHELAADATSVFVPLDLPQTSILKVDSSAQQFAAVDVQPTGLATDASGNVFVGLQRPANNILKLSSTGAVLATYSTPGARPFGMDLDRDQCTLLYLTESAVPAQLNIVSQNVCVGGGPVLLGTVPADYFDLVILPDGNLLLARFAGGPVETTRAGVVLRTYSIPGVTTWRGLALDVDGLSVWLAGFSDQWRLHEVNLATGAVQTAIVLPPTLTTGVAIVGGWRAAAATVEPIPLFSDGGMLAFVALLSVFALLTLKRL